MRVTLLIVGAFAVIVVVLLWPPAVVHISHDRYTRTIRASMSDARAVIIVIAIATLVVAVVSVVITAMRHRTNRLCPL